MKNKWSWIPDGPEDKSARLKGPDCDSVEDEGYFSQEHAALIVKACNSYDEITWIPVSESLPPLSDFRPADPTDHPRVRNKILVAVDDGSVFVTIYTGMGFANVGRDNNVTHWMPLPESPKLAESDK